MIRFQCPSCQNVLQASPELAGEVVRCFLCQGLLRAPADAPVVALAPRPDLPPRLPIDSPASNDEAAESDQPGKFIWFASALALLGLVVAVAALNGVGSRPRPERKVRVAQVESVKKPPAPPEKEPDAVKEEDKTSLDRPEEPEEPPVLRKEEADPLARRLLAAINTQRRSAAAPEVVLNAEHSQGCREHAVYLMNNAGRSDLDLHDQDSTLPGATPAGRQAARSASVVWRDPVAAVNDWLSAPAHRALMLDPALESVGLGVARGDGGKMVSVVDLLRGSPRRTPGSGEAPAILYPVHRQQDVPLEFPGNETPDPLPEAKNKTAGFPITATFSPGLVVPAARAWLEDETGKDVPVWFSSPTRPANERFPGHQQNTVCLFAREVLRPGMRYVVHVQANGVRKANWSRVWSFTTVSPVEVHTLRYKRAAARLNAFRKGSGLPLVRLDPDMAMAARAHADYLARHLDHTAGVEANEERPGLPSYTAAGAEAAKRSAIHLGGGLGQTDAVDWMMYSVVNRNLVLNPTMTTVGFGAALHAPRGWIWVVTLPGRRVESDGPPATLYPGRNQSHVPLYYGREVDSLAPGLPRDAAAGFAVTATFFPSRRATYVKAELTDARGQAVDCWLSTPAKPLPGMGADNQIILVPKKPLAPATTYTAAMSALVGGKPWKQVWKFTTTDPERDQAEAAQFLLERINRARTLANLANVTLDAGLSRGCALHAGYIMRNIDHPKVQGLGMHDEDKSLPGATAEGAKAGKASVIAVISDPVDSVAAWMATLYHRIPLLDPRLKRLGYGQAQHPSRGWVTVLDSGRGK